MPPSFDSSFETTPARNSAKTRSMIVRTSCVLGTDRQATFRQAELGGRKTAPCRAIGCECQRPIAVASFRPLDPLVCFAVSKNGPRPCSRAPCSFRMISHGLDGMTRTRIPRDYKSAALPIELRQPRGAFRRLIVRCPDPSSTRDEKTQITYMATWANLSNIYVNWGKNATPWIAI